MRTPHKLPACRHRCHAPTDRALRDGAVLWNAPPSRTVFEKLKASLRDAMARATSPAETRAVAAMMRDALVEAKIGLTAVRAAVEESRGKLSTEQSELETVRRRGRLAAEICDHQTVQVALQFERRHTERLAVIEHKLKAQEEELALAERDVAEMTAQFRSAAAGIDPFGGPPRDTSAVFGETDEVDALRRELERAARESDADRRLAELKRRMGK